MFGGGSRFSDSLRELRLGKPFAPAEQLRSAAVAAALALVATGFAGLPARTLAGTRIAVGGRAAPLIVAPGRPFALAAWAFGRSAGTLRAWRMRPGRRARAVAAAMLAAWGVGAISIRFARAGIRAIAETACTAVLGTARGAAILEAA